MSKTKRPSRLAAAILILACLILLQPRTACAADAPATPGEPSVQVKTVQLVRKPAESTLSAYGQVLLDQRQTTAVVFPRKEIVDRLMVATGQVVHKGDPLVQSLSAPEELAAFRQAQLAVDYARRELERVRLLFRQQLATKADLATAEKSLEDAQASFKAQYRRGSGTKVDVARAPFDGVVSMIAVKPGDLVPAGGIVLQIGRSSALQVALGVEPEDVSLVSDGMQVHIKSVFDHERVVDGTIAAVHGIINPQTRLVDILVDLPEGEGNFIPGMQVRGRIVLATAESWVVPRSAVVRDADGRTGIFQVRDGRAVYVSVTSGVEMDDEIAVSGNFDPKLPVVVTGNYELRDGMAVRGEGQ